MSWLGRSLLATYLAIFALLARDPEDARAERRLLLGGIEYSYRELRTAGRRSSAAVATAFWWHLGELQPCWREYARRTSRRHEPALAAGASFCGCSRSPRPPR